MATTNQIEWSRILKLVQETHDSTLRTEAAVLTNIKHLEDHDKLLFGNGRPGVVSELQTVRLRQVDCPARKAYQRESRMFWIGVISVVVGAVGVAWTIFNHAA